MYTYIKKVTGSTTTAPFFRAQVEHMQVLQVDDEIQAAQVYPRHQKCAVPPRYYQPPQQRNCSGPSPQFNKPSSRSQPNTKQRSECSFCQGWQHSFWGHTMINCKYISQADKQDVAKGVTRSYRVESDNAQLDDDAMYDQDYDYEEQE